MKSALESIQYWFIENANAENITSLGIVVVAIFLVISIYKLLKSFHPTMVLLVLCLIFSGLFLYWVNERNEPAFMTPLVETVADFLPKKGELRDVFAPTE